MRIIVVILSLGLLLASCSNEKLCAGGGEQHTPGKITRISGPDTLKIGKTSSILVEVEVYDSLCITGVDASILSTDKNYIQIGADLAHTGERKKNCDCIDKQKIYTVVYFTPNANGIYVFGTEKLPGIPNVLPNDSTVYRAIVR